MRLLYIPDKVYVKLIKMPYLRQIGDYLMKIIYIDYIYVYNIAICKELFYKNTLCANI